MDSFEREYKIDTLDEIQDNLNMINDLRREIDQGEASDSLVDELFRIIHNVKGNAKSANFEEMSHLAHFVENVLLKLKNKEITLNKKVINIIDESHSMLSDGIDLLREDLDAHMDFSQFCNSIDVDKLNDDEADSTASDQQEEVNENALKVLIIDDDETIIELLSEQIQCKYDDVVITTSNNGEEGLKLCQERKFDVVVTDFEMPIMSGIDFIKAIRLSEIENNQVPVLMLTGHKPDLMPDEKVWDKVFFLDKPITVGSFDFVFKCALRYKKAA